MGSHNRLKPPVVQSAVIVQPGQDARVDSYEAGNVRQSSESGDALSNSCIENLSDEKKQCCRKNDSHRFGVSLFGMVLLFGGVAI